ncbi:MAG: PhoX family protein [Egibacteraceae bacterium]
MLPASTERSGNEPFEAVVGRLVSRRVVLKGGLVAAAVRGTGCAAREAPQSQAGTQLAEPATGSLTFAPIEPGMVDDVVVPEGYGWEVLLRWGDPVLEGAPEFDFNAQTPEAQAGQFGYNCDWVAFFPQQGARGLLWVNHEFTYPEIMLPGWDPDSPTLDHVNIEIAAIGGAVVAVEAFEEGPSQRKWELHHPRSTWPTSRMSCATSRIAKDGRVAFYLGDDQRFDYVYKFVTAGQFREGDRDHNLSLLDEGTLSVARFGANGTGEWLALVHGEGGLNAASGFEAPRTS